LFREHMQREIMAAAALFEGAAPTSKFSGVETAR